MHDLLADTHAIIWALFEPSKLSSQASRAIQSAQAVGGHVLISAITPIEVIYLVEKGKLSPKILTGIWSAVADPAQPVDFVPVSADVARMLDRIPRATVPDMPDRIVAATALAHSVPLVSADQKIRALRVAGLSVVW